MSETVPSSNPTRMLNFPNQVTMARVALALVLFVFLALQCYLTSFVLFIVAASTDWLDGYWARRYGLVTQLGRVLDPFADKLVVCGTFIFLAAVPHTAEGSAASGITAWMTVVIVGRELLVTALRTFVEKDGGDFSAQWAGKWKMVAQCTAACFSMFRLTYFDSATTMWNPVPPDWMSLGLTVTVWLAIVLTIYSGYGYVRSALRIMGQSR